MPQSAVHEQPQTWESDAIRALLIAVARRLNDEPRSFSATGASDHVTGLMTRTAVEERGNNLFAAARARQATVSVVIIDVDGLKDINAAFGAAAGDAVLAHVAQLISMNIQPGVDLAGRLAGAAMILVLPEAGFSWAASFAERLRGTIANRPLRCGEHMIEASACFGVASIVDMDQSFGDIITRATRALATAKNGGPNVVRIAAGQELAA